MSSIKQRDIEIIKSNWCTYWIQRWLSPGEDCWSTRIKNQDE